MTSTKGLDLFNELDKFFNGEVCIYVQLGRLVLLMCETDFAS